MDSQSADLFHARQVRHVIVTLEAVLTATLDRISQRIVLGDPEDSGVAKNLASEIQSIKWEIAWQRNPVRTARRVISAAEFPPTDFDRVLSDIATGIESFADISEYDEIEQRLEEFLGDLEGFQQQIEEAIRRIEAPTQQPTVHAQDDMLGTVRFLLFSDLHRGLASDQDYYPQVQRAFFEDLKRIKKECGDVDLVLFAGDYVNRGTEYDELTEDFLKPLWRHFASLQWKPVLVGVPGNHDLVRPTEEGDELTAKRLIDDWKSDDCRKQFWDKEGCENRELVKQIFRNYESWWKKCRRAQSIKTPPKRYYHEGMLPGDFSYSFRKKLANNKTVALGVVGLNSAFLQLISEENLGIDSYQGRMSLYVRQFHRACGDANEDGVNWTSKQHVSLLITHHPHDWLENDARECLLKHIYSPGEFLAHLHGHMHKEKYLGESLAVGRTCHHIQAPPLFGEECYLNEAGEKKQKGLHGFVLGEISFTHEFASLRFAPRKLKEDGQEMEQPRTGTLTLTPEGWTEPFQVRLRKPLA